MTVEEMKNVDIRTVDPETLVDVTKIEIDDNLSPIVKDPEAEKSKNTPQHGVDD